MNIWDLKPNAKSVLEVDQCLWKKNNNKTRVLLYKRLSGQCRDVYIVVYFHLYWWCWAVVDCTVLYWAVLGCAGLYWTVHGCTGLYWTVLDSTGLYWTWLIGASLSIFRANLSIFRASFINNMEILRRTFGFILRFIYFSAFHLPVITFRR